MACAYAQPPSIPKGHEKNPRKSSQPQRWLSGRVRAKAHSQNFKTKKGTILHRHSTSNRGALQRIRGSKETGKRKLRESLEGRREPNGVFRVQLQNVGHQRQRQHTHQHSKRDCLQAQRKRPKELWTCSAEDQQWDQNFWSGDRFEAELDQKEERWRQQQLSDHLIVIGYFDTIVFHMINWSELNGFYATCPV